MKESKLHVYIAGKKGHTNNVKRRKEKKGERENRGNTILRRTKQLRKGGPIQMREAHVRESNTEGDKGNRRTSTGTHYRMFTYYSS